jgi:hypothetical protein
MAIGSAAQSVSHFEIAHYLGHVLLTIQVDFTAILGPEWSSPTRLTGSKGPSQLDPGRKVSVKNWFRKLLSGFPLTRNRQRAPRPMTFAGPAPKEVKQGVTPNQARTIREQEQEEERLARKKSRFPPAPEPIEGRACVACGSRLVLIILNYYCEPGTDVITPADKVEKCLGCGRLILLVSRGPERQF